jgi:hypothetical protein
MFEIGVFCVIILAVAYWTVLWLMGRREDVLHGEFVEGKAEPDEPVHADARGIASSSHLPGTLCVTSALCVARTSRFPEAARAA